VNEFRQTFPCEHCGKKARIVSLRDEGDREYHVYRCPKCGKETKTVAIPEDEFLELVAKARALEDAIAAGRK
jgi:DNA-directed RNA polymerase subunit RPC12/RpoP